MQGARLLHLNNDNNGLNGNNHLNDDAHFVGIDKHIVSGLILLWEILWGICSLVSVHMIISMLLS